MKLLKTRRAQGIMSVVLGLMIAVFIGAILVEEFEGVIDDQRGGASAAFNNTADDIVSYTWITFTFLALGILIVGGAWILRQSGMIG